MFGLLFVPFNARLVTLFGMCIVYVFNIKIYEVYQMYELELFLT